ncbi:MAG: pilus assembly protein [Parvularculaceae bacterium]|nr:pilus assembly protein [Parvularculaceae bacterium]
MRRFGLIGRFRRDSRGAALVEFSLVAPLLVLLAAGLAEFGVMLNQQQVITKSVRDAARYAARTSVAFKSCPINTQPEWTQLVTDTQNIALRGSVNPTAPLLISSWNNASMVAVADSCVSAGTLLSPAGGGTNIPVITVTATVPYAGVGFLGFLGLSPFNLTAAHSQMWTGL